MFEGILEIALICFPTALFSFFAGWFSRGTQSSKLPQNTTSPSRGGSQPIITPRTQDDFALKRLQLEVIELNKKLDQEKKRSEKLELLVELNPKHLPVSTPPITNAEKSPVLPLDDSEWRVLVLHNRIRELEAEVSRLKSQS